MSVPAKAKAVKAVKGALRTHTSATPEEKEERDKEGKKKVSFAREVKATKAVQVQAKHPSDMSAFERIAYVQALDLEKEQQRQEKQRRDGVDEDIEEGRLTGDVMRKFLAVHLPVRLEKFRYKLRLDFSRKQYDEEQTNVLREEITSGSPDLMRVVQCLERGADPNANLDRSQAKPLHAVIRRGDPRLVDYLLQAGADVNGTDARNQTPLAKACDSKRVDRSYIKMVEVLLAHPDVSKGLEYRDAGSNTALLNAIFRSNVWLTRLLLKKKAKVTTGKRNAYDVATFIMASHIHLDIEEIPDFLLHPPSRSYKAISYKGRYHSWKEVFLQSLTNSDIELVFRMVQYRHEELEREQAAGKAAGEQDEKPKPIIDIPIGGSAEAKRMKRVEREMRRKRLRAERREQEEREKWEKQKAAMVARVDEEFSVKVYRNPTQNWKKDPQAPVAGNEGTNQWVPSVQASTATHGHMDVDEMAAYRSSLSSREAYRDTQEHFTTVNNKKSATTSRPKYGSSDGLASDITITSDVGKRRGARKAKATSLRHSTSSSDLTPSSGQRWTVKSVEYDKKLYGTNPLPGISLVSIQEGQPPRRESRSAGN